MKSLHPMKSLVPKSKYPVLILADKERVPVYFKPYLDDKLGIDGVKLYSICR